MPNASLARATLLLFLWICAAAGSTAAEFRRLELPLNQGWRFHFGTASNAERPEFDDGAWTAVNLPHTWNAGDGADGGNDYARGTGWYRTRFRIGPAWAGKRVFLQFDGASRSAKATVNGVPVGEHLGGFARFRFDITDAVRIGEENLLVVAVDNTDDGAPPITADFTFFGGLYRGVRLFATDPLHIDVMDHASDGVFVTQDAISRQQAEFSVRTRLRNASGREERVMVRVEIFDGAGERVASQEGEQTLTPATDGVGEQRFTLASPRLWNGIKDPHRYRVVVSLWNEGQIRDAVTQHVGLRSFSVDPNKGFFLNGEYLDLRGVCRHQDRAGKGWAIGPDDEREDFALIREMGANAIRVAHYPQSDLWFDLADEHGMIVWAEIPVVNEVPDTALYTENARQQLRELIRQYFNRPAICFWGVGNEVREMGELAGGARPNGPEGNRLIADLAKLARTEDATRLSVYASYHRPEDVRNFHTDILGYNKYIGWYGGTPDKFAAWADGVRQKFPALRLGVSEYGAGANPRQHESAPKPPVPGGPWHPEEYQNIFHELHWQAMSARPYLWSKFIWNMFDFAADQRAEGEAPGMNDKGLVSYDRKLRKDAFYFYKANWSAEPVLYVTSRRFTERTERDAEVKVYSNAAEVELFVNDRSHGVVTTSDRVFRWQVALAEGANRIRVRARIGDRELRDECTWMLAEKKTE